MNKEVNPFLDSMLRDRKSLVVLSQKFFQAFAGVVTLYCITMFLTPTEQGYYYTFASLAALQTLLEMGLSTVLVQQAAHEFIHLEWQFRGCLLGQSRMRFLALAKKSICWYGIAGLIFLLVYPGGFWFFAERSSELDYLWQNPWLLLVISTAVNLVFMPLIALIEGSGRVIEIYSLRLLQSFIGAVATWVVLYHGGGLYAVSMMPLMSALFALIWSLWRYPYLLKNIILQSSALFDWRTEVWPLQWQFGVSWLCGYLGTQIHTPLLFKTQNPIVSGQMGLTLTFCNMLGILSLSWMTSRVPLLARAAGQRNWALLDAEFGLGFTRSVWIYIAGAISFVGLRYLADETMYGIRFLPVYETIGLILSTLLIHINSLFGIYLRAHRKEPFMRLSIITAVLTSGLALWAAPRWGATGIIFVLLLVNVVLGLPASFLIFRKLKDLWHQV